MELVRKYLFARNASGEAKPMSFFTLGVLISVLLILNGLLFKTYAIAMTSPTWEAARQLGLSYVFAETCVIIYAVRRGLDLGKIWSGLPFHVRSAAALFLIYFWIGGTFFSDAAPFALAQNVIFIVHVLFALATYHSMTLVDVSSLRQFVHPLGIGLFVFCGMTAWAFLNHPPITTMPDGEIIWQFVIPGFISVRLFGAFCGAIFCLLLAQLLLDEESEPRRISPYLWLTLCGAMTVWSGTRNAILGIVVVAAIMLIFYGIRVRGLKSLFYLVVSAATAIGLALSLIPFNDPAFMLVALQDTATAESISGGRASYWNDVWNAYLTVPWFGAGPFASFWILPDGAQTHVQPHNIILQFLLSWGLPATLLALAILAYATWKAHCVCFRQRQALPFLAMLDCLLVMSLFDGMAHFAQPLMLMMICFGVIFSTTKCAEASV